MIDVAVGFGVSVRVFADSVTHGAWAEQWQHHVRTTAYTPVTQSLTEVLIITLQAHLGANIEETAQTEGGVDDQACGVDPGGMRLELQDVVGQVGHVAQVEEHIVDAIFQELRGDRLVSLGQRLERVGVEGVVEGKDRPVDALPRIFLGCRLGCAHWRQQQAGTDTGPGHPIDHACTDPTHRVTPRQSLHKTLRVLR
ncbi:hypothetical protein D3C80_1410620 [compost metagenome]